MKTYTIQQLSQQLAISKQTLRYYDSIGLVVPHRGENKYRTYSHDDYTDLKLILMLKKGGFDLTTIKSIIDNRKACDVKSDALEASLETMRQQRNALAAHVEDLKQLVCLLDDVLVKVADAEQKDAIDEVIDTVYTSML